MSSQAFGAFIGIDGGPKIADPPAAVQSPTPTAYELDEMVWGNRYNGPSVGPSIPPTPSGIQTPKTPNELEMSRPPTPKNDEAVDVLQTLSNPPMNKWRLLSCCLMCFGNGLNDSAPGALIPYMEKSYNIGYAMVSLIFITNALGFIAAAPSSHWLQAKLGRSRMLVLALGMMIAGYIMIICSPPFPVVVTAFFVTGLGMAWNLALNNVFCANLANSTTTLGAFHGSYGIGGTVGPLMATALVSHGKRWSNFYLISLGVTSVNIVFAAWSFWNHEIETLPSELQRTMSRPLRRAQTFSDETESKLKLLKQAIKNKTTILGALFIFAYQGAEVSISGWVISFLISYRHSEPSRVGYVTAGFWGGITLGRFLLTHPAHKIGEKVSVVGLVLGAAAFQLLVWLAPNVIGEAVAVSIVGLLLGPVYPCSTAIFSRLVGRKLQMSSLSFISALGSSGGAVMPFMTGLIAQESGTWVLHPIAIGLFGSMLVTWLCLPRMVKRRE